MFACSNITSKKKKMRIIISVYWARSTYLSHNRLMSEAMHYRLRIYILAIASITFQNVIYQFNINSRKLDGYYRSWIEYLNERYKVYILERSINLDNNTDRSVKWTINIQIWYTFVIKQIETNTRRVLRPIEKSIHKNNYLQSWSGSKTRLNAVVS